MKKIAIIVIALACSVALAQDVATMDDYCILISERADKFDAATLTVEKASLDPNLPESDRTAAIEYLRQDRLLIKTMRRDACHSKDLATAKAAVRRDMERSRTLTNNYLTIAKHNLAENLRKRSAK